MAYDPFADGAEPVDEAAAQAPAPAAALPSFDTPLPPDQETAFQAWKAQNAPNDSGQDYDLRGAFKAGVGPDLTTGHWPDTFKKPNHPTFSVESQYASAAPEKAGHWEGDKFIPPTAAFDPFAAGAEAIDEQKPTFDPFAAGAESAKPEGVHDWFSQFKNALNIGRSDVTAGVFNAVSGLARGIAVDASKPEGLIRGPLSRLLDKVIPDPFNVREENKAQVAQFYNDAADYWKQAAAATPGAAGVDPALENTAGAKAAHLITGTGVVLGEAAIPEVGIPLLLAHNSMQRYGEVFNQTGDAAKAANARNISLAGNALFMGQGHAITEGLEKVLPAGANAVRNWVIKASAATGGNIATGQLIKAADAAALAPEGERMTAFTKALEEVTIPDAALQLAFGVHSTIASQARAAAPEIAPAEEAVSRARTVAPRTAQALQETVVDPAVAEAEQSVIAKQTSPEAPPPMPATDRIFAAQKAIKAARQAGDPVAEANAKQMLDDIAAELVGGADKAREIANGHLTSDQEVNPIRETITPETVLDPRDTEMAQKAAESLGLRYDGVQGDNEAVNITDPATGHTFTMEPGSTVADLKAKIETKVEPGLVKDEEATARRQEAERQAAAPIVEPARAEGPLAPAREVPPVIPAEPLPEPAAPPTAAEVAKGTGRTPEEKAAQVTSGTAQLRAEVAKTGIIPRHTEVQKMLGDSAAAKALRTQLADEIAKAYPPETLPEGATENVPSAGKAGKAGLDKNPLTGDVLPTITEPGGRIRPKFTNDPNLTAQQIDTGVVSPDKANRLYVPDEIMDNDQLNPAIDTAYDKEAGKFYVMKAESEYGTVAKPDDFSIPYKADKAFQKAHQLVFAGTPDEVQNLHNFVNPEENSVGAALVENGFKADAIKFEPNEVDVPEGAVATASTGKATSEQAVKALKDLEQARLITRDGSAAPDAVRKMIAAVADGKIPTFPWMRIMADRLARSGVDLSKVEVELVNRPNAKYAATYTPNAADVTAGKMVINIGTSHASGIYTTILHELFHHATIAKAEPSYKRNGVEQKAYENLQALYEHASREVYKLNFGKEGTPEEIAKFQAAQRAQGDPAYARAYYGLGSLREFIAEALSNPKFMKVLQQFEGLKGIKVRTGIKNLLVAVRDALKTLFTGSASRNATMDQVLDQSLQFIEAGAVEHARAGDIPYVVGAAKNAPTETAPAEDLANLSRPDLETRAEQAGLDRDAIMTMTQDELRAAIKGEAAPEPAPITEINTDGWLSPDGTFRPVPIMEGGHENMAGRIIGEDPQLAAEYELAGGEESPEISSQKIYGFMAKKGFIRVIGGGEGGTMYIQGKPTAKQKAQLIDAAKAQHSALWQDFGENSRPRPLYTPDQAFSAPAEDSPTAPKITTKTAEDGTVSHSLEIPDEATKSEMLETQASLADPASGISDADKFRMNNQLIEAIGPTAEVSVGKAKDRVVYGYDAVQNIANNRGKQVANSIALDFGSAKDPTPEQLLDRESAPFVVEAGGNKEELVRDLMSIIHSKDPALAEKFAPIIQHAIDNFDRLNTTTQNFREQSKTQLERERAHAVNTGEVDNYVTRLLDQPDAPDSVLPGAGNSNGGSTYFMKGRKFEKLADAIKEGFVPRTTDIVDLMQKRIESGERLVQQKLLEQDLKQLATPDGQPILGAMDEYESITGKKELTVPRGYTLVQTGGRPLVVNSHVASLFKALYGDSTINQFLKQTAGTLKRNTLVLDTYHVGRIMFKELAYSKGAQRVGYNKGLSLLEYSPEDISRAVESGDVSPSEAAYTNEVLPSGLTRRGATEELLKRGLNIGKVSDNLLAEHAASIPWIKNFNPWVFQKLSRGAMIQTALENFERNMNRFPELGIEGNARRTAKEYNEVFGNMQNQGLFKNKSYQDLARALVLAPGWAESQLRAELRGYGQIGRAAGEAATGKFRLGTVAQGQLTVVLGMLAANQIANYITTGHSTFENKKENMLDAFIPGGSRGFWFSPLEIGSEYLHMAERYFSQHQNPIDIITRIAANKLGPVGRASADLIGGKDYAGRPFSTFGDRVRATLTDLIPLPIGLSGTFERDPRQPLGFRVTRQPGSGEKQLLQSAGLKVSPVMSPTSEIFALAYPFRSDRSYQGPVDYRDLRGSLDNQDESSTQKELALLASRGKTEKQILAAVGVNSKQKFTDNSTREVAFVRSLTPDQRKIYDQAQHEHKDHAKALLKALRAAPTEVRSKLRQNTKPELPGQ